MLNARDTLRLLADPVPQALISTKEKGQGKGQITFIHWYDLCDLMDERCPMWTKEVRVVQGTSASVVVRITVPTADGPIVREATGTDDEPNSKYGSPLDRAEASALRRCFSNFGLGRFLYGGEGAHMRLQKTQRERAAAAAAAAERETVE